MSEQRPSYYTNSSNSYEVRRSSNPIAQFIQYFAWIELTAGFIMGIVEGYEKYKDFLWQAAMIWWITSAISCLMLLGFSEIIRLLDNINNKLK